MALRAPDLSWISRDAKLIIAAKGANGIAQGFLSVVLAVYLAKIGFSLAQIGLFLGLGLAGSAVFSLVAGVASERVGRRRLMVMMAVLAVTIAVALAVTEQILPLLLFAFVGSLSSTPGGPTPTQPLEQAGLAGASSTQKRTELFALYRMTATSTAAIGSLAAGLPTLLEATLEVSELTSFKLAFGLFATFRVGSVVAFVLLSPAVESSSGKRSWTNPLTLPSRRMIFTWLGCSLSTTSRALSCSKVWWPTGSIQSSAWRSDRWRLFSSVRR